MGCQVMISHGSQITLCLLGADFLKSRRDLELERVLCYVFYLDEQKHSELSDDKEGEGGGGGRIKPQRELER